MLSAYRRLAWVGGRRLGVRFGSSSAPKEVGREKVVASTDGLDLKEKPGEAVGNEDEVKRGTPLGYSSTSFGFRMERVGDEDDPKKWIKYGLKYAGALVVFFAVLGSLKSYEVSQRKKIDAERRAREGRKNLPPVNPSNADISNVEASSTEPPIDMPVQIPVATGLLFPIKTEEPEEILDPIDELLVEEVELDAKLNRLRREKRTSESDAKKKQIKIRLQQVQTEISTIRDNNTDTDHNS